MSQKRIETNGPGATQPVLAPLLRANLIPALLAVIALVGCEPADHKDASKQTHSAVEPATEPTQPATSTSAPALTRSPTPADPNAGVRRPDKVSSPSSGSAPGLDVTGSVVLVEADDTLNVRAMPGAGSDVIATLDPSAASVTLTDRTEMVSSTRWRQVLLPAGTGWVAERFIVHQPVTLTTTIRAQMIDLAQKFVRFGLDGGRGNVDFALDEEGVYFAGIGVYGDFPFPPQRVPASELSNAGGWTAERTWAPPGMTAAQCQPECTRSALRYLRLPPPSGTEARYTINTPRRPGPEVGPMPSLTGAAWVEAHFPASSAGALDWTTLRIHMDFDRGTPAIWAIQVDGWTP